MSMSGERPASAESARARRSDLRLAMAKLAHDRGVVRLETRDIAGFDHVASTRHGLFAVAEHGCRLIAPGLFYGISILDGWVYAFEAGDRPRNPTARGRIVRFRQGNGRIGATEVVATGLDNGCHQIDFIGDELHVVDTYQQRIVVLDGQGVVKAEHEPFPFSGRGGCEPEYVHLNSILRHGGRTMLLLHNGGLKENRRSELAVLDDAWQPIERRTLDGYGCHSLAALEDGTILTCGSLDGELIGSDGLKVRLGDLMTRGLSIDQERVVVGGSTLSTRDTRDYGAGLIYFLDRAYRLRATVATPAPVMEIRRLDGCDRSLSRHLAAA